MARFNQIMKIIVCTVNFESWSHPCLVIESRIWYASDTRWYWKMQGSMPWQVHCDIIALEMHCRCPICQFNAIYGVIIGLHRGTWLWQVVKNFHFCFQLQSYVLNHMKCTLITYSNLSNSSSPSNKYSLGNFLRNWS